MPFSGLPLSGLAPALGAAFGLSLAVFGAAAAGPGAARLAVLSEAHEFSPAPPAPDPAAVEPTAEAPPPPAPAGEAQSAPAPAPLPALNAAVRAALEARAEADHGASAARRREQEAVASFYILRDFAPLWSKDGAPAAEVKSVLQRLQQAGEDGLSLKAPARLLVTGSEEEVAASDVALSAAVVAYARQASGGRIDPRTISPLIALRPETADPALALALVASAGPNAGAVLRAFNPPNPAYAALRDKLMETRRGAPAARQDLRRDGRVASVADLGRASGLPPLADPSRIEAEILANMERWRWMPRDMGESRIEVNIPEYEVVVIEAGSVAARHRVVVGKEGTPTPVFSNTMKFLIVNPSWTVPQSIIRKEMMPKIAANPNYLKNNGYHAEWREGRLAIRQPPGERNALGRIKFMFPNDYAVYLHDTPSRKLFAEDKRAYSHGCVRVDEPLRFAETVLGAGWTQERLEKMFGGKERYVNLPKPLPIHLQYFTAKVDDYGQLQLYDDIYGYSRKVRAALGLERKG